MNLIELNRALRQLRLGGIAAVLEMRLHQAQVDAMAPIDLISCLVADELTRRGDRLLERRRSKIEDDAVRGGGFREDVRQDGPPGVIDPVDPDQAREQVAPVGRDAIVGPASHTRSARSVQSLSDARRFPPGVVPPPPSTEPRLASVSSFSW